MRDHRQAGWATATHDMPQAAGKREQLPDERRRLPTPSVKAPSGQPPRVGATAERAQARVRARATMLDAGAGHIQHACVRLVRAQAFLPLLLVAAMLE